MTPRPTATPSAGQGESAIGDAQVLVVGGGVAGATLTYELARRGIDVLLVEQGRVAAQGASSLPAALLNPHRGRTARASATDLAGIAAFWQLAEELAADGLASGARRSGVLRVPTSVRQARDWQRLPGPVWLEPQDVPSSYEAPHGAMLIPDGGWVEPVVLLASLTASAIRHGARVVEGARVLSLRCDDHGVEVTVSTEGGAAGGTAGDAAGHTASAAPIAAPRAVRAGHVVLCVGAGTIEGVRVPRFEHAAGAAIALDLGATPPYPLAGSVNAAFVDGRAVVNGGHVPADATEPEGLRTALARFVPQAQHARILSTWTGVRVRRTSGVPVARRLHAHVTLFGAMAGRGFLTAAWYARRLATRLG